jgi:hypothetical protein
MADWQGHYMTFSIIARAPVIRQGIDTFHERLATENESYSITDIIGFDRASFSVRGSPEYLRAWFRAGLARDITITATDGRQAWQGYINGLSLTIGASRRVRSLNALANRIYYVYTALDTATTPPTAGAQTTITQNDTTSQANYGIKTTTVSGGERTSSAATTDTAATLADAARIWEDGSDRFRGGGDPELRFDLLGYAHMLDWFNYSNAGGGTIDRDALIKLIVADDPNSILSTDMTRVDANTEEVEQYREGSRSAWSMIQEVGQAGANSARWVAGVYENRKLTYKQAEGLDSTGDELTANKHSVITRSLYDAGERFFDRAGRELQTWQIRPDRLVMTTGLSKEPQYVEQVSFSAPVGLEIKSKDANPLRNFVRI